MKDSAVPSAGRAGWTIKAALDAARALLADGRDAETLASLEGLPAEAVNRPALHMLRGQALMGLGRFDEAEASARKALALRPDLGAPLVLICRAVLASDNPERIVDVLHEALEAGAALQGLGFAIKALSQFPEPDTADLRRTIAARFPVQAKVWLAHFGQRQADSRGEPGPFHRALAGDVAQALSVLTDEAAEVRALGSLAEAQTLLRAIPGPDRRKRDLVHDSGEDLLISPKGGSGTTVVVFTGLARGTMVDVEVFDAFLAGQGLAAIYLRDPSRNLYLNGVPAVGPGRSGTIEALRRHLGALDTRRIVTVGTSAGGYAAILYGLALGARRIVSCAGPTVLNAAARGSIGDARARIVARRLQSLFPPSDLDLRPHIEAADQATRITVAFGAQVPVDAAHAARIADLPNVSLLPVEGHDRHNIIVPMLASGHLIGLLTS